MGERKEDGKLWRGWRMESEGRWGGQIHFFLSLFIVFAGPINLSEDSRIHAENNQGDHMLLLRGRIYSISFRFAFLRWRNEGRKTKGDSGKFHPILLCLSRPKIFIYTWGFHHFLIALLPLHTPWKIKIFSILSFALLAFLSFRHLREWKKFVLWIIASV